MNLSCFVNNNENPDISAIYTSNEGLGRNVVISHFYTNLLQMPKSILYMYFLVYVKTV